jgi:hypothetical protein
LQWVAAALILVGGGGKLAASVYRTFNPRANDAQDIDFYYLYAAGLAWRQGLNPYDITQYHRASPVALYISYAYAPTSAAFVIPVSHLSVRSAKLVFRVLNVAAALTVAAFLAARARQTLMARPPSLSSWLLPASVGAVALAAPSVSINLLTGQNSLIAVAWLCLAWQCRDSRLSSLAGVCAALASFKPSIGAFVFLALLMERNRRTLCALILTSLALAAIPLYREGPLHLTTQWFSAMRAYGASPETQPGHPGVYGLPSLLADRGLNHTISPLLALGFFVWVWSRRHRITSLEFFAVALTLPVLFIRSHVYDDVALLPLFTAAILAAIRRGSAAFAVTTGMILVALLPGTLVNSLPGHLIPARFREVVEMMLLVWTIVMLERNRRGSDLAAEECVPRNHPRTVVGEHGDKLA